MPDHDLARDDPSPWLEQLERRVNWLLDPGNPLQQDRKVEELLTLSNRFLELSRKFLELGKNASQAAQQMLPSDAPSP